MIEDDYVRGRFEDNTRWVAKLSNGFSVFEDDNRPGLEQKNSWLRLKEYIEETGLRIVGMYLQFRSHIEKMPDNAAGYYLSKGAGVYFGAGTSPTYQFLIAGVLDNDVVRCTWWKCPELIIDKTTAKTLDDEIVKQCLIKNP